MADAADTVFSLKLRTAIPNQSGDLVEEISLRKPRGGDMIRIGSPVRYVPGQDIETATIDYAKAGLMIAALSGIPAPMIERMDPNDLTDCAWGIAGFFLPGFRPAPTA